MAALLEAVAVFPPARRRGVFVAVAVSSRPVSVALELLAVFVVSPEAVSVVPAEQRVPVSAVASPTVSVAAVSSEAAASASVSASAFAGLEVAAADVERLFEQVGLSDVDGFDEFFFGVELEVEGAGHGGVDLGQVDVFVEVSDIFLGGFFSNCEDVQVVLAVRVVFGLDVVQDLRLWSSEGYSGSSGCRVCSGLCRRGLLGSGRLACRLACRGRRLCPGRGLRSGLFRGRRSGLLCGLRGSPTARSRRARRGRSSFLVSCRLRLWPGRSPGRGRLGRSRVGGLGTNPPRSPSRSGTSFYLLRFRCQTCIKIR